MHALVLAPIAALAALTPFVPAPRPHAAPQSTPNVLLIVLDDMGPENLSFWPSTGVPPVTTAHTPTLAGFAQSGAVFTNAWVQPLCAPTRACLQTGQYAFRTGFGKNPGATDALDPNTETIADVLSAQYATGLFGKWHLGDLGNLDHPIECGYDRFDGMEQNAFAGVTNGGHYDWKQVQAGQGLPTPPPIVHSITLGADESQYTTSVVGDAARAWILAQSGPWFACVNFNAPHAPHQIPPMTMLSSQTAAYFEERGWEPGTPPNPTQLTREERIAIFDAAIEAVDTAIGRLTAGLTNTVVLIVGDNGTGQSAVQPPYDGDRAKGSVYALGTRTPVLAIGPGVGVGVCPQPISAVDFPATIAALAGAAFTGPIDGVSFQSLLSNPSGAATRTWAFCQGYQPFGPYVPGSVPTASLTDHERGITDGRFHYVRTVRGATVLEELYDLALDPLELNDRIGCYRTPGCMLSLGYTHTQILSVRSLITTMTTLSEP